MTTPDIAVYAIADDGGVFKMDVTGPNDAGRYVAELRFTEAVAVKAVEIYYQEALAQTLDTDIKAAPGDCLTVTFGIKEDYAGMFSLN